VAFRLDVWYIDLDVVGINDGDIGRPKSIEANSYEANNSLNEPNYNLCPEVYWKTRRTGTIQVVYMVEDAHDCSGT
jgi:hypothetical protein